MKKGTIYRNLWAGHETYFVYQGSLPSKRMQPGMSHGYGLMLRSDGKWRVDSCVVQKSNQEMSETLWNIGREQSGRSDYILNGKYYPESEEGER